MLKRDTLSFRVTKEFEGEKNPFTEQAGGDRVSHALKVGSTLKKEKT